jgi:hypothetical protein
VIDINTYILEVVLKGKFLKDCGDIVSGDGDFAALDKSGLLDNLLIGEICISFDGDSADYICLGSRVIHLHLRARRKRSGGAEDDG